MILPSKDISVPGTVSQGWGKHLLSALRPKPNLPLKWMPPPLKRSPQPSPEAPNPLRRPQPSSEAATLALEEALNGFPCCNCKGILKLRPHYFNLINIPETIVNFDIMTGITWIFCFILGSSLKAHRRWKTRRSHSGKKTSLREPLPTWLI